MKNILNFKKILVLSVIVLITGACEDFLNRPTEDSYTIDSFYKTDEQCIQAANVLYNAPWYDFQRGWGDIGDVMSGNIYKATPRIPMPLSALPAPMPTLPTRPTLSGL